MDSVAELEQDIAQARAALAAAEGQDKADLESRIGTKTAALEALQQQQEQQYASERDELEALRREKRERETRESVQGLVAQVATGVKAQQAQESERLQAMIAEEMRKAFGGQNPSLDVQSLLAQSVHQLAERRTGRKFVPDGDDGPQGGSLDGQSSYGRKGGPAYLASHKMGEKPTFAHFLWAVGRKDRATVGDIQRAMGMQMGTKSLIEGGGAIDATAGPSGGYLVPVEFSREIIQKLTASVVVRRGGARVQQMQSPVFRQPRLTGRASASWVGEAAAIASSQETFDQFQLNAKKLAALVPVSNELINDSDPVIAQVVTEDMALSIGLLEDSTFLLGTGSTTTPSGILTLSGITSSPQSAAPTYNMVVSMVTDLAAANVPEINRVWICHPYVQRALMEIVDGQQRPIFADYMNVQQGSLLGRTPTLYGYPLLTTTQMTYTAGSPNTGTLALVDLGYCVIGQVAELEIKTSDEASFVDGSNNTISAWQSDLTLFRGTIREDVAVTHPAAISVRTAITV